MITKFPDSYPLANCYGYVLGINYNVTPGTNKRVESPVSNWHSIKKITPERKTELLKACKADGLRAAPASPHKIGIFINEYKDCIDYHFYIQDNDKWLHKFGAKGAVVRVHNCVGNNLRLAGSKDPDGQVVHRQLFCGYLYRPDIFLANISTFSDD